MIKNKRQYKMTKVKLGQVRAALAELESAELPVGISPEMRALQTEGLVSVLGDLEAELVEYESLRGASLIEQDGIGTLPTALIRARIARGLTQRELAERIGVAEQAIQRYEASDYAGVSFARLVEVANALSVTIHYDVRLSSAG